jgi:hypothetical protein
MKFIEILNYDDVYESIAIDQIQSVVKASGRANDSGAIVLLGGRRIALSARSIDQASRILRELQLTPVTRR